VLLSLACATSIVVWVIGVRQDLGAVPVLPLALYTLACLASFGVSLGVALVPASGGVLPSGDRSAALSVVVMLVTVPLGLVVGVHAGGEAPALVMHGHRFWPRALACVASGLGVALVPATLGVLALRKVIPLGAWRHALAVGAASGVLAGLTLELHCPISSVTHVGLAHGSVMVVPALLLALLGIRLLAR
jgi:hypothetical protein